MDWSECVHIIICPFCHHNNRIQCAMGFVIVTRPEAPIEFAFKLHSYVGRQDGRQLRILLIYLNDKLFYSIFHYYGHFVVRDSVPQKYHNISNRSSRCLYYFDNPTINFLLQGYFFICKGIRWRKDTIIILVSVYKSTGC